MFQSTSPLHYCLFLKIQTEFDYHKQQLLQYHHLYEGNMVSGNYINLGPMNKSTWEQATRLLYLYIIETYIDCHNTICLIGGERPDMVLLYFLVHKSGPESKPAMCISPVEKVTRSYISQGPK